MLAIVQRPRAGAGASSRLLQMFSSSIVDQILLSAGNFFIGFMLIRRTSDFDYGLFVVLQSTILLLASAQGAWLSGPLAVLAPKRPPEDRRQMVGAVAGSHRRGLRLLTAIALLFPIVGYATGLLQPLVALVAGIGVLATATALKREFLRGVLLVYARPNAVLKADFYYVGALVVGALLAAYGPHPAVLWASGALVAAGWLCAENANRSLARNPGWVKADASAYWREIRPLGIWSAVGAVIYWCFGQSYN